MRAHFQTVCRLEPMKTICAAVLVFASVARAEVTSFSIIPSATDPAIKTFNTPHRVFVNRDIVVEHKDGLAQDQHELLLWLGGTQTDGANAIGNTNGGPVRFLNLAADLGYHVVGLKYPADVAAADCREDSDASAFERFRLAIIQGGRAKYIGIGNRAKSISIERSESIENRLVKLLVFLKANRAKDENWGQFLKNDGTIRWEAIAVGGLSQGGGHAALIGVKHRVARVLCFGAPKDYNKKLDEPAAWYREMSVPPKARFFAFNHRQDAEGCTPEHQLRNLKALRLDTFSPPADVDTEAPPFHHARILYTGYPAVSATSEGDLTAHTSVTANKSADLRKQVWTYMLTEQTP